MHVVEQDGNTEHRERPPHIQSRMDSCNRGRVDCHTVCLSLLSLFGCCHCRYVRLTRGGRDYKILNIKLI